MPLGGRGHAQTLTWYGAYVRARYARAAVARGIIFAWRLERGDLTLTGVKPETVNLFDCLTCPSSHLWQRYLPA